MKKKVLLILSFPEGGIGKHLLTLCQRLNQKFDLSFATNLKKQDKSFRDSFKYTRSELYRVIDQDIKKEPNFSDLKNIYQLYKLFKDEELDIIHGHGAKGGLYARLLGMLLKTKIIYTPHGGSLHSNYGFVMQNIYTIIEKLLYRFTDKIIFESKYSYDIFIDKISDKDKQKLIINYNGVIQNQNIKIKILKPNTTIKISSFGLHRHLKGHDLLIKAISILIKKGYNISLTIYGQGEEKENLTTLIHSLKLEEYISLHPFVADSSKYMLQSDIIVHPSRFESLPYTPIEAMNLGIPVVVSDAGGLKEIVKDGVNGLVFRGENFEQLANKIETLINDNELYQKLILNAHSTVGEKFNELKMCKRVEEIYCQI